MKVKTKYYFSSQSLTPKYIERKVILILNKYVRHTNRKCNGGYQYHHKLYTNESSELTKCSLTQGKREQNAKPCVNYFKRMPDFYSMSYKTLGISNIPIHV